jgi:hypothetical protein
MKAPRHRDKEASVARRGRTGSPPLEGRLTFAPRWVSPACVAQAYERVVPITRRRAPQAGAPPPVESTPPTQQGGRRPHACILYRQ